MDTIAFEAELMKATVGLLVSHGTPEKLHRAYPGKKEPLSVTPDEGRILFALSRALQPKRIVEMGTGTGYSTALLAAGWPTAHVVTVDSFSEGGVGEDGPRVVKELWNRLKLTNIELIYADIKKIPVDPLKGDLLFLDGTIKGAVPLAVTKHAKFIVEHDAKGASHRKYGHVFSTPCYLSIHTDDEQLLKWCKRFLSIFISAERTIAAAHSEEE